jgi:hypothetical protein
MIINNILDNINEIYSKEEIKSILSKNDYYKCYFGKAKNRTMIKKNPKLYKSIIIHTDILKSTMEKYGNTPQYFNFSRRLKFIVERNYNIASLKCSCGKRYTWSGFCNKCPDQKKTWLNRNHSTETKLKMRLSAIEYIKSAKGCCIPRYNKDSIILIEEYGKEYGYKFQHAENGGEHYIKELGYWVDGYDKEKNIVIEIDEKRHYNDNNLLEKDILRQREIESLLDCKFIRIRYDQK